MRHHNLKQLVTATITALTVAASVGTAGATVVFTGSGVNSGTGSALAASAAFTFIAPNTLQIVLTNTSAADVVAPSDILTAVFFDIAGFPPATLTPVSAALTAGSVVAFGTSDPGGVVGGEWAYGSSLSGAPGSAVLGTSSSGFGLFGSGNFPGTNLQGPAGVDGVQYGITSAGDNLATGNTPVTGTNALIKNSVTFTLTASTAFSESDISNVSFQYGTGLDEPNIPSVPEPTTLFALGTGLVALGAARKRNRKL